MDANVWAFPTGDASFYGRTQVRPEYPSVSNGVVWLRLDTHNPSAITPGDSFFGSEILTREKFSVGSGCRIEVRAQLMPPGHEGLIGGIFLYEFVTTSKLQNEIDWELLSNFPYNAQTNIYANEFSGRGHPTLESIAGLDIMQFNTYRIDRFPDRVRWYINDILVREERSIVPSEDLSLHLNFWAPAKEWLEAYAPDLVPVAKPKENQTYDFSIDWVRISEIVYSSPPPTKVLSAIFELLQSEP